MRMLMTICSLGEDWLKDPSSIPVEEIVEVWREQSGKGRYEAVMEMQHRLLILLPNREVQRYDPLLLLESNLALHQLWNDHPRIPAAAAARKHPTHPAHQGLFDLLE